MGFMRLAMQERAHLVPVLSLGEVDLLDNVRVPDLQRWFLRRIGFAAPFNPYGLWYLPIPRPVPVTVIVGRPVQVAHLANPTDAEIKRGLFMYFTELQEMFDKHERVAQQGLPKRKLVFLDHSGKAASLQELREQWGVGSVSDSPAPLTKVTVAKSRKKR